MPSLYNREIILPLKSPQGGHEEMLSFFQSEGQQLPLIQLVESDDKVLLNNTEAEWFKVLYYFPWQYYRQIGAAYYDALYEFNIKEADKREERQQEQTEQKQESKEEAVQRLLFGRPTMQGVPCKGSAIIYLGSVVEPKPPQVSPHEIAPGVVPHRYGGKRPKCFFALFKSFLGATLMGFPPEPEWVQKLLLSNPSFVRVCGYAPKEENDAYCFKHVPRLRKLQQFDAIMRDWGLWERIKWEEVQRNIKERVIKKENELVGDTTHYHAYSGFETVEYEDAKGKEKKKSQSKVTKACRCQDRDHCPHPWQLADEGAGTIVKSNKKMYWGHKASVLGLPRQGVPLDAAAVTDAALNDGKTFFPHVEELFENLPQVQPWIDRVLYDSACDDKELRKKFKEEWDIELKASFNPRRKKEVTKDLPRGIDKITPYGTVICKAGYEMHYQGIRFENEKFIYRSAQNATGSSVCLSCPYKVECCPHAGVTGRTITLSFDTLPHINFDDPPMAKRFKAIMSRRTSVERMIKQLKCDLSDDRLSKRGTASFQAYLDKTMIAFHILLRN